MNEAPATVGSPALFALGGGPRLRCCGVPGAGFGAIWRPSRGHPKRISRFLHVGEPSRSRRKKRQSIYLRVYGMGGAVLLQSAFGRCRNLEIRRAGARRRAVKALRDFGIVMVGVANLDALKPGFFYSQYGCCWLSALRCACEEKLQMRAIQEK